MRGCVPCNVTAWNPTEQQRQRQEKRSQQNSVYAKQPSGVFGICMLGVTSGRVPDKGQVLLRGTKLLHPSTNKKVFQVNFKKMTIVGFLKRLLQVLHVLSAFYLFLFFSCFLPSVLFEWCDENMFQ